MHIKWEACQLTICILTNYDAMLLYFNALFSVLIFFSIFLVKVLVKVFIEALNRFRGYIKPKQCRVTNQRLYIDIMTNPDEIFCILMPFCLFHVFQNMTG